METIESDLIETSETTPVPEPKAASAVTPTEPTITHRNLAEWQGRELVDQNGRRIGRLENVYYDVETQEPQFGTVKQGLLARHLTFVPLTGITIGPDNLQVPVTREQVKAAPNLELNDLSRVDESRLYHHYELNYTPLDTESGRRLARR
jgi:sporulation protein YlmC with PRC-barrel domain